MRVNVAAVQTYDFDTTFLLIRSVLQPSEIDYRWLQRRVVRNQINDIAVTTIAFDGQLGAGGTGQPDDDDLRRSTLRQSA